MTTSNEKQAPSESSLTFTYHELLALNKLLGRVNKESHLTADELHFFSMSPFFISAFKKIHQAMSIEFRKDVERRNWKRLPKEVAATLDPTQDFRLNKYHQIRAAKDRFQQLGEEDKQYIRSLEESKLRVYCELHFAPFIPMEEHIIELMEILKAL